VISTGSITRRDSITRTQHSDLDVLDHPGPGRDLDELDHPGDAITPAIG